MLRSSIFIFSIFLFTSCFAQVKPKTTTPSAQPKLVVGLVIDQMRWDYLHRYNARYTSGGFKRLMREGFSFDKTYIPYVPSYTAVGHSTIYNGSVPAISGIVGNNWWDKSLGINMYCTSDSTVASVGTTTLLGKMSPRNMWVTSITDELRLSNNFKSKVIGIALKDRSSILPAGQSGNAAYWFDETIGKWITSTYYMQTLPTWVNTYNNLDLPGKLLSKDWTTLFPINTYTQSTPDEQLFEGTVTNVTKAVFPYKTSAMDKGKYSFFKYSPDAATYTFDFAKKAIESEQLGKNTVPDFLTVSISSTDYAGHAFGPNSIEVEDSYLRLDRDIEDFLKYLDVKIGKGNYIVFLTSDHGAAHVPEFLNNNKIQAGTYNEFDLEKALNSELKKTFGLDRVIVNAQNYQVYLNDTLINRSGKSRSDIESYTIKLLQQQPYITNAFATRDIAIQPIPQVIKEKLINGYEKSRSGDIQFLLKPGYFDGFKTGTTHGLWNPYDTHIPLLFFGWNVPQGHANRQVYMYDIAPTIAAMLHIQEPNGCVGTVLTEIMK